ncbi:MAG TPA: hypothetical protein VD969_04815 [Symbiobacteriaceae bacterium]|nr:hypothetical protein [Symbiobacteriaceae bacterium]
MIANNVLKCFADSESLLTELRMLLEDCRRLNPARALDHLNVGASEASDVYNLAVTAHRKGVISRADLTAAMQLAEAWLAFDNEVLAVVADAIPVVRRTRSENMMH